MTDRRSLVAAALLIALAAVAAHDLTRLGAQLPWRQMFNFPAFYCAGGAIDAGRSPYSYEPQHSCQHRVATATAFGTDSTLVIPAPQPPYDFPPFMLLARLGYPAARAVYAIAILLAVLLAAAALTRVAVPFDVALLSLALSGGYLQLNDAQIVPFALLCIILAGVALATGRERLAGCFATLGAIEPHLALPTIVAIALFVPKARWSLAGTAVLLAAAGVWSVGLAGAAEYLWRVLPTHAISEIGYPYQFSLTYALHTLGVSPLGAQLLGDLSFVGVCGFGIWLAPQVARKLATPSMLAYVPAACAVTASPFLHMVDIPLAIPAALIFATRLRGPQRTAAAAALCLLVTPWIQVWGLKTLFAATLFVCTALLFRLEIALPEMLGTLAGLFALIYAFELHPASAITALPSDQRYAPNDLAQAAWKGYTDQFRTRDPGWLLIKTPVWAALGTLLVLAYRAARSVPARR